MNRRVVVSLRPVTVDDAREEYLSWLREAAPVLGSDHLPKTIDDLRADIAVRHSPPTNYLFAIVTDQHVGNISLHVDLRHLRAEVGVLVGEHYRHNGYAFQAHRLVLEIAFNQLGMRKVWAGFWSENAASASLYRALGFKQEGVLRQHDLINGVAIDVVRVGLLKNEFE